MKPVVEKDTCIGCGLCADVCPEVFFMDGDGKAAVKKTAAIENQAINAALNGGKPGNVRRFILLKIFFSLTIAYV